MARYDDYRTQTDPPSCELASEAGWEYLSKVASDCSRDGVTITLQQPFDPYMFCGIYATNGSHEQIAYISMYEYSHTERPEELIEEAACVLVDGIVERSK